MTIEIVIAHIAKPVEHFEVAAWDSDNGMIGDHPAWAISEASAYVEAGKLMAVHPGAEIVRQYGPFSRDTTEEDALDELLNYSVWYYSAEWRRLPFGWKQIVADVHQRESDYQAKHEVARDIEARRLAAQL